MFEKLWSCLVSYKERTNWSEGQSIEVSIHGLTSHISDNNCSTMLMWCRPAPWGMLCEHCHALLVTCFGFIILHNFWLTHGWSGWWQEIRYYQTFVVITLTACFACHGSRMMETLACFLIFHCLLKKVNKKF